MNIILMSIISNFDGVIIYLIKIKEILKIKLAKKVTGIKMFFSKY